MLLAIVVVFLAFVSVWLYKRHFVEHLVLEKLGIKGPKPTFILGNGFQLRKHRLNVMNRWVEEYGEYFGFYYGGQPVIVIKDLDTIKKVFIENHELFVDRPGATLSIDPLDHTILYLKGQMWKTIRSCLTHAFSPSKMRRMVNCMSECSDIFLDIVRENAVKNKTFDMNYVAQGLTLDIITKCALAMDVDCQHKDEGLRKNTREFFENADHVVVSLAQAFPFLIPPLKFVYSSVGSGLLIDPIIQNLEHVIKLRREGQVPKQPDMLQVFMECQKNCEELTDKKLTANLFLFLLAGFETSATSLAFITLLLAERPEVQDKIIEEVRTVLPGKEGDFEYEDLQKLEYLDRVIKECMRVHPPVILIVSRYCPQDTTVNGYFFPAGCQILVPVHSLHHDPKIWEDAEEFKPERFLEEDPATRYAHLPFGLGPRICIGTRFALFSIKLALVKLFMEFKIVPGDGFTTTPEIIVPSVIQNPKFGIPVKAEPR